jgi:hypothetical protein
MIKELSSDEAEEFIIDLLKAKETMTTSEVEAEMRGRGFKCTDGPARVLSRLKFKGVIQGKLSIKNKGWIWWL